MFKVIPPERGYDDFGSGAYGASRGRRIHRGIDFEIPPGSLVCSPVYGKVTKLGFTYSSDLRWRYVQVTDQEGLDHRLFYVIPDVTLQSFVAEGDPIGIAQDISSKHNTEDRKMKPHVHYEIKRGDVFINPEEYWNASKETKNDD